MTRTPDLDTGVLYCNDNVERLPELPENSVDLIYLDPPFFSNRNYEVVWGDEAEVRSFEDRWAGGIENYVDWMRERAVELHRVLKPGGTLYLHCDPHASHYLKVMLDKPFGHGRFRTEIIWKRSTAHSDSKQGRRLHGHIHDTILMYTKGEEWTWNTLYTPHSPEYIDSKYTLVERGTGRRYQLTDITGPGGAAKGNPQYKVMGVTKYWRYSKETMQRLIDEGRIVQPRPGAVPRYKRYLDETQGVPLQDVWTDISPINSQARERLGWPTQKPEALLERLIMSSTNEGDVVLDPFCGCGTSVVVAERLRRRWIGIDISATATEIMKRRLIKATGGSVVPTIIDAPTTVVDLQRLKPFEFQNWIINAMNGTHSPKKVGDMGIDGYSFFTRDPIQVKQSEHVGRNVVDNFETAMRRGKHDTGYIVAFSFTRGAIEEAARARADGLNIKLAKVAEVILLVKRPDNPPRKLGPQPASVVDLPLPPVRKAADLPSAEDLIASDMSVAS